MFSYFYTELSGASKQSTSPLGLAGNNYPKPRCVLGSFRLATVVGLVWIAFGFVFLVD